jgi:hypothetical protein
LEVLVSRIARSRPVHQLVPMVAALLPAGHPAGSARHPHLPLPLALLKAGPTLETRSQTIDLSPYRLSQLCAGVRAS